MPLSAASPTKQPEGSPSGRRISGSGTGTAALRAASLASGLPVSTCKLLVVGNAKCGKTSVIRRFAQGSFENVRACAVLCGACVTHTHQSHRQKPSALVLAFPPPHAPQRPTRDTTHLLLLFPSPQAYVSTVGADYLKRDVVLRDGRPVRLQVGVYVRAFVLSVWVDTTGISFIHSFIHPFIHCIRVFYRYSIRIHSCGTSRARTASCTSQGRTSRGVSTRPSLL